VDVVAGAGPDDHVGVGRARDEAGEVRRGVRAVGVGDEDQVGARFADAPLERRAVAAVRLRADHAAGEAGDRLGGAVGRSVVDDEDLEALLGGPQLAIDLLDRGRDPGALVVGGDHDRQIRPRTRRSLIPGRHVPLFGQGL
jgi:hypothetical protein